MSKNKKQESQFKDIDQISVTKGDKTLQINNPTTYSLIGMGAQGAVFQISEDKCVKIYPDPAKAKMEQDALKAGEHLEFFPRVFETGENYSVMEYLHAPTLKEYLKNSTHLPESVTKKLIHILRELKQSKFTMIDAPLRHIFVLENEEFKVIDHVNSFKRQHPVPLKLLRDLNIILLKEAFLDQVKQFAPDMYDEWHEYYNKNEMDFKNIDVTSGGSGSAVKVDSAISQPLVGKGHQGAVYRISEDKCVKIYPKNNHAEMEQEVLLSNQELPFIPTVYETAENYTVMEYLLGPDLNSYLKKQAVLTEEVTIRLLEILKLQKANGFKLIDAPLRHVFVTADGFKMIDHVYSYTREQDRPIELFQNLHERTFLDVFLEQVKELEPELYSEWTKEPIPLEEDEDKNKPIKKSNKGKKKDKKQKRTNKKKKDKEKNRDRKETNYKTDYKQIENEEESVQEATKKLKSENQMDAAYGEIMKKNEQTKQDKKKEDRRQRVRLAYKYKKKRRKGKRK